MTRAIIFFPIHRRPHCIEQPVNAFRDGGRRGLEASCKRAFFAIERWMRKAGATRAEVDRYVADYCLAVDAEIDRRVAASRQGRGVGPHDERSSA